MKVVATYSIKGGVGKTSAAVNLGALAARDGLRTVIWDLDPQGAATFLFRVEAKVKGGGKQLIKGRREPIDVMKGTDIEGLDILPADFRYRHLDIQLDKRKHPLEGVAGVLARIEDGYDLAILDCAPSISLVSESVFTAADLLLVPLIPSTLSARTLEQLRGLPRRRAPAAARGARVLLDGRPPQAPAQGADGVAARLRRRGDPVGQRGRADGPAARAAGHDPTAPPGRARLRRAVGRAAARDHPVMTRRRDGELDEVRELFA